MIAATRSSRLVDTDPAPLTAIREAAQQAGAKPSSRSSTYVKAVFSRAASARRLLRRGQADHSGNPARRFSIHSGVAPGKVVSSERASALVWVMQGITAGASPSSGWQANLRRIPLGS
jgi:hypothetical protein